MQTRLGDWNYWAIYKHEAPKINVKQKPVCCIAWINIIRCLCYGGTSIIGLTRCLATLPMVTRNILVVKTRMENSQVSLGWANLGM